MRNRPDYDHPFACGDCGVAVTEASAYYAEADATPRCWRCHCIALGVWGERGPTVMLDRNGRIE